MICKFTLSFILIGVATFFSASAAQSATEEIVKYCTSSLFDKKGICLSFNKKLRNCPPLLQLLRDKNFTALRQTFCDDPAGASFDISWVKVCCPIDEIDFEPEEDFKAHPNFKLLPTPENSLCGRSGSLDRIIGGEDVAPGALPWMARIGVTQEDDDVEEFACGGTIISDRYILSAAHCFKNTGTKISRVRIGDTSDDVEDECIEFPGNVTICEKEQNYEVDDVVVHDDYTGIAGSQHDIALIRLSQPIQNMSSLFTRPICLPFAKEFQFSPLPIPSSSNTGVSITSFVSGWGKLQNSDSEGSPVLQTLPVPIQDNFKCGKAYKANNITISELQICAGGEKGKGSCSGDSGGPLTYPTITRTKPSVRNFQIGVVSFGKYQCATGNAPVVFTRVKKYLSWILDNIKE